MDQQKVDMFFLSKNGYFPPEQVMSMRERMLEMDDNKAMMLQSIGFKDPTVVLIISILVGELGVDRFMLGDVGLGVLKLITLGGCGIWWLIDVILIMKKTREYNAFEFNKYAIM